MEDEILVLLTTDHAGVDQGHRTNVDDVLETPVFVRGPGVKKNYQFKYEVKSIHYAPTVLYAMGYKPSPWWSGHVLTEMLDGSY